MNSTDQFEVIVSEHYEALYRFAMSFTRSESDACDLTQQTFYVWAKKGHQLRDVTKVKTWLFTTLHRAFLHGRRRQSRFHEQQLDDVVEQMPAASPVVADRVDALQVSPAASPGWTRNFRPPWRSSTWMIAPTKTSPRFSTCRSAR
jgi:RNA polymerase sigma-70 factor, ECF subfamily